MPWACLKRYTPRESNRYLSEAFRLPALLVERALGLRDSRQIYLTRHLLTHLFFIAGGFACGMLAYRMLGSRWVALLAMLMFLLHPRLYAHSFFNVKDIPFAVALVIALYLTHRAFRRDTLGAFLLCGICVGFAIDMRPFGLTLPPMILAMRGLDLWQAGRGERKRILASAGIFAAAAIAVVYIIHPYYWENPLRFIEGVSVLSRHPVIVDNLFMGEIYKSDALPWNYIPVWFAITSPPLALGAGRFGSGGGVLAGNRASSSRPPRPRNPVSRHVARLRSSARGGCHYHAVQYPQRLAAYVFPVGAILPAGGGRLAYGCEHTYGGGYFGKFSARPPRTQRGGERLHMGQRTLAYGVVCIGLTTTLTAMVALHPHQHIYFKRADGHKDARRACRAVRNGRLACIVH